MRSFEQIVERVGAMENERANVDSVRQQIADHLYGERDFQVKRSPGERRRRLIFDSTALFSWKILSSAIFNFLFNPDGDLFDLTTEDPRLMEQGDVRRWVETSQERLRQLMARPVSGFATAGREFVDDLTGFGMGVVFVEDVPGVPFRFSARPISEVYVAEDAAGRLDTIARKFELTSRQAVARFGDRVPRIRDKMSREPTGRTDFWHLVHPTSDPLYDGPAPRPWRSVFIAREERAILEERFLNRQPTKVARWDRRPGNPYSEHSPGHVALPEGRMLNAMSKTLLESAQLKARPPVAVADEDVINPLNLNPEGQNVVRSSGFSTDPIRLLETTGDIGLTVEMFDRRRQAVRSAYMHDLLEILQQPVTTATQVIEMVQRARGLLAPTISRLQVEALEPVIDDAFQIAFEANAFDPPPRLLRGSRLKVVYRNPVARSQREGEIRAIDDFVGFAMNVAQVKPEILDNVDWDQVLRERHRSTGVPEKLLQTIRQVQAKRDEEQQLLEQRAQQEQTTQQAETLNKLAPLVKAMQEDRGAAA